MSARKAIVRGGLAVGILDITFALVYGVLRGSPPQRVLQSIATGLLGRPAYEGGVATAVLGLALHFVIAFSVATIYYAASRVIAPLARKPLLFGPLYGIAVYFFMQLVVLPLSAVPWTISFSQRALISGLAAHIFCVGLPIAIAVNRADAKEPARQTGTA